MPELVAGDAESAAWLAAADERYRDLRTHLFVELSETCTTDHSGRAADAAAALVLPELKSVYVGYLAARDGRDELRERVAALEASRESAARRAGGYEFERDQARAEADRLRAAWEQAWAERNEARSKVAEQAAEVARLRSIHGHDFTNTRKEPVTCVCGVTYMDWLEDRKAQEYGVWKWGEIQEGDAAAGSEDDDA